MALMSWISSAFRYRGQSFRHYGHRFRCEPKSVHLEPESLSSFRRNRCPHSAGISVQLHPEYAPGNFVARLEGWVTKRAATLREAQIDNPGAAQLGRLTGLLLTLLFGARAPSGGALSVVTDDAVLAVTRESVSDKLLRYLLNPAHPDGESKAKFFREVLGFTRENADDLVNQIIFDSRTAVATKTVERGQKFEQVITITGANGRVARVTFLWIRNKDGFVRLVTMLPRKPK